MPKASLNVLSPLDPMIEAATDLGTPSAQIMIDVIAYHADVTLLPATDPANL
jgi:hypothetical protein